LQDAISGALGCCDVVITVGGVSVGDYDFVKDVLAELGVEQVFWKINMKPGKPNYFGVHAGEQEHKTLVFGLPGNPVSAQVSLHQLVRPALQKLMGVREPKRQMILATLTKDVRRKAGRREFLRGIASTRDGQFVVEVLAFQGSHMQGGLALANCLIDVPPEQGELREGQQVRIELLTWM
jgi:molybdopterin molybdotransferase